MSFLSNSIAFLNSNTETINMLVNIILSIATIVVALFIGLLIRRQTVQKLKTTVLDNWLIQTFGVLIVAVPLILGAMGALAIWNANILQNALDYLEQHKTTQAFLANTAFSIVWIALGIGAARTVTNITTKRWNDSRIDINIRTLLSRSLYFVVLGFAGFLVLSQWKVEVGIPVAILGALTVAITVAFQDILKNLVAGVYILAERPFYIGDLINITSGMITYTGKVEDIQLRITKIRLTSGEEVSVPNFVVFSNAVTNNTYYGERRATIELTIPLADFSREELPEKLLSLLKEHTEVMEKPEPTIMVSTFKEEKVTLLLRFWIATGQMVDISNITYDLHELLPGAEIAVKEPV